MTFLQKNDYEPYSFFDALQELYCGEEPLAERLVGKLLQYDPGTDREATARKIRNWRHDRNYPKNREELFKVCFALGLTESQADSLLGMTAESGIHLRNPRELIYAFCMRKGLDYPQAAALVEHLWGEQLPAGGREYRDYYRNSGRREATGNYTESFRRDFESVQTEEELKVFLENRKGRFGLMHNTAYRKFRKMLECLMNPQQERTVYPKEQAYSIRKLVNEYIRMGVPYKRKTERYTWLQREIKKHWPSDRSIYEMYKRKLDVDRKTLLLLYLATEGEGMPEEEHSVLEHRRKMNIMLAECGMPVLDRHNPFDCLIMEVCRNSSEEDYIGMQMERAVRKIFAEEDGTKQNSMGDESDGF